MNASPVFVYVEDDPLSRQVMRVLLTRRMGYDQVHIFEDSADFMARLQALPARPDVIFMDIHLKPDDGFALLGKVRSDSTYQGCKVIALTASVMNEEVEDLRRSGFDGGIAKPVDQASFPTLVKRILAGECVWHIA